MQVEIAVVLEINTTTNKIGALGLDRECWGFLLLCCVLFCFGDLLLVEESEDQRIIYNCKD